MTFHRHQFCMVCFVKCHELAQRVGIWCYVSSVYYYYMYYVRLVLMLIILVIYSLSPASIICVHYPVKTPQRGFSRLTRRTLSKQLSRMSTNSGIQHQFSTMSTTSGIFGDYDYGECSCTCSIFSIFSIFLFFHFPLLKHFSLQVHNKSLKYIKIK